MPAVRSVPGPQGPQGLPGPALGAGTGRKYAALTGANTGYTVTSGTNLAALQLTTVADLRALVWFSNWATGANQTLVGKGQAASNLRQYSMVVNATGFLTFSFSTNGTNSFSLACPTTILSSIGDYNAPFWLRAVGLSNDGGTPTPHSRGTFYFSLDNGATWIKMGQATSTQLGPFNPSTAGATVGAQFDGTTNPITAGRVFEAEIWDGTPTLISRLDVRALATNGSTYTDAVGTAGATWTPKASVSLFTDKLNDLDFDDHTVSRRKLVEDGYLETSEWDKTGATDFGATMQSQYDVGVRHWKFLGSGSLLLNTPMFFDADDSNNPGRQVIIEGPGCTILLGPGLPTSADWDTWVNANGKPNPGTQWAFFPSTLRSALSGGIVSAAGNYASPSRATTHPHFILRDISVDGQNVTNSNAGAVFGNRGGATRLERVHLQNLRVGLSWTDYTDGNSAQSVTLAGTGATVPADAKILYQISNGDGIVIDNCKVSQNYKLCSINKNLGGSIRSTIGGGMEFNQVDGITIQGDHQEQMSAPAAEAYIVADSRLILMGGEAQNDDGAGSGMFYVNDSNVSGSSSHIDIVEWGARRRVTQTDLVMSADIYLNQFGQESTLRVRGNGPHWSVQGSAVLGRYARGYVIDGNATNIPSLAAAVAASRDVIGSGEFIVQWRNGTIDISAPGQMGAFKVTRPLGQASITAIQTGAQGANGTLTNGQLYEYAIALAFTMPNGSLVYGQASAAGSATATTNQAISFQATTPTAPGGCTLVVWRKTGAGVLASPDHYIALPWGFAQSRLLDTGANLNSLPWLTASVPVPNSVAATDHTAAAIYVDGVSV